MGAARHAAAMSERRTERIDVCVLRAQPIMARLETNVANLSQLVATRGNPIIGPSD